MPAAGMTPRIVVVHGALGSAQQMRPVVQALEALGTVHNVELPGHGNTPLVDGDEFSIAAFVRALQQALRGLGAAASGPGDAPVVFGYSMGGYVALATEAQNPGTFSGIVTLGTKFAWTPEVAERDGRRLNPAVIAEKIPAFAKTLEDRHRNAGGWEALLQRTAALLGGLGAHPLLDRNTLAAVHAPVVVAVGERDDTVTAAEAEEFAAYMPNGRSVTLPDAPHPIERVPVLAVVGLVQEIAARTGAPPFPTSS